MAIVTGPLMSLGAKGKIAKTLVFSNWKGKNTVRQLVKPANPKSTGQQVQRDKFGGMVALYRAQIKTGNQKEAWDITASLSGKAQSGFNAFMSAASNLMKADSEAGVVTDLLRQGDDVSGPVYKLATGDLTDQQTQFDYFVGLTKNDLQYVGKNLVDVDGKASCDLSENPEFAGRAIWVKLAVNGKDISGITYLPA